jgi:dolichol-phosphate mannosyltransferase
MVRWVGYKQAGVLYRRDARFAGRTKYPFWSMARLAGDAMVSFSTVPLRMATLLGTGMALACLGYAAWAVGMTFFAGAPVHGWASLMVAILLIGSAQLVCLGIVGEYVGRIYDEVRARPLYLVAEHHAGKGVAWTARSSLGPRPTSPDAAGSRSP